MRIASRLHRRDRGQAAVVLALGGVTLVALVGLALDGGMAVGAYRHAQNAADAGALAAARQVYLNALSGTQSDADTLQQVARLEVQRNNATLGSTTLNSGTSMNTGSTMQTADGIAVPYAMAASLIGSVFTGAQTVYVPNVGQGLTGESDLADVSTTAGTLLQPVAATMQLGQTRSSALMQLASAGGSVASSRVAVGVGSAPSLSETGALNCWQATATYHAGQDTVGTAAACGLNTLPSGVSLSGALSSGYGTDARVYADNHPTAAPRMVATSVSGTDGAVTVTAATASSGTTLDWDPVAGLIASASTLASTVHMGYAPSVGSTALSVDTGSMGMTVSVSVNAQGVTSVTLACLPASVTLGGTLVGVAAVTASVDSSCNSSGVGVAGMSMPSIQPAAASACSTAAATGVVTCAIQACFLRVSLATVPYPTSICVGEATLTLSASPVTIPDTYVPPSSSSSSSSSTSSSTTTSSSSSTSTSSSSSSTSSSSTSSGTTSSSTTGDSGSTPVNPWLRYSGAVTVTAQITQPTYFLGVFGWSHTTPNATASADLEAVIDESAASFAASPFAMPDMAWTMGAGSVEEHLTVGHSYYLYGPSMLANSPSTYMQVKVGSTWQGQLAATSAHRVGSGSTVTGAGGLTTTPQAYMPSGAYLLEPIFNPVSGVVECYGVFVRVPGQQYWYTLVNSAPSAGGYTVQATSQSGWITFDEGAVSVKLVQ
jgi:Flp pilus assembly protein TadG